MLWSVRAEGPWWWKGVDSEKASQQEFGRPGAQTASSMRHSDMGEQGTRLERQRRLQGCRACEVMPKGRGLKAMVWTLDFTLRTGREAIQATVQRVVLEGSS